MALLSVLIPSRSERFLRQTVEDLLKHATSSIEVIVCLDGAWPVEPLPDTDPRLRIIHLGSPRGMRACINAAAGVARGEYLMKIDAHCKVAEGFDEILKADCADDWVVIPRRKRLDAENWDIQDVGKPDVDYEFLSYPLWKPDEVGIHGTIWTERIKERLRKPEYDLDDNPAFQGSCYFTTRKHWERIGGLPEEGYFSFIGEPQQLGMKTWLSGGRVVINKAIWIAHLHKGKRYGRGYSISNSELKAGNAYSCSYWMNDSWPEAKYTMEWFVSEKFPDMPTWPNDWKEKWNEYTRKDLQQIPA